LKSTEEFRSQEASDLPDHVAESVAGQNILVDLRISELLDTAAKLFDRALRQPSAIAEESAYLAQELQKVANGQSSWAPPRNDKRFNDPAWTENTFYKNLLQGYMAWSQSLQNFAQKAGL
jgi:polyhydroxyalkanoate synthase